MAGEEGDSGKTKMALGAGGIVVLLATIAGLSIAVSSLKSKRNELQEKLETLCDISPNNELPECQ